MNVFRCEVDCPKDSSACQEERDLAFSAILWNNTVVDLRIES